MYSLVVLTDELGVPIYNGSNQLEGWYGAFKDSGRNGDAVYRCHSTDGLNLGKRRISFLAPLYLDGMIYR